MHSITCLHEKNLFIWVCLICRKEKSESKNEQKEQEGWNPGKETRCVGDIIFGSFHWGDINNLTLSLKNEFGCTMNWNDLYLIFVKLTGLAGLFLSDLFIDYLFIYLLFYWIIYLYFRELIFRELQLSKKKIYLNEKISIQAEMSSKFMKIMYKLQFSISR